MPSASSLERIVRVFLGLSRVPDGILMRPRAPMPPEELQRRRPAYLLVTRVTRRHAIEGGAAR